MRTSITISKLAARVARLEKAVAARAPPTTPSGIDSTILPFLGSVVVGAAIPMAVFGAASVFGRLANWR